MARIRSVHPAEWDALARMSSYNRTDLYLIQEGSIGPVKVGIARNVFLRMSDLQAGNHRRLALRSLWVAEERALAVIAEAAVLQRFAGARILGEWLDASPAEVSDFIDGYI